MKISDAHFRDNNLNLLQFLAALLVMWMHAFVLSTGGNSTDPFHILTGSDTGRIAVSALLSISGFLCCASYLRTKSFLRYILNRFIRIFPEVALCTLLTIFVLGASLTSLTVQDFLKDPRTVRYMGNMSLFRISYSLPGVFDGNGWGSPINGSLWTIPYQCGLYLFLGIAGGMGLLRYRKLTLAALVTLIVLYGFRETIFKTDADFLGQPIIPWIYLGADFLAGIAAYQYRDTLALSRSGAMLSLLGLALTLCLGETYMANSLFLTYVILYLAYCPRTIQHPLFNLSYGLYIYAFPIQQLVVHWADGRMNPYANLLFSIPLTLLVAWLSRHCVGAPVLRLKDKLTDRFRFPDFIAEPLSAFQAEYQMFLDSVAALPWSIFLLGASVLVATTKLTVPWIFASALAILLFFLLHGKWVRKVWTYPAIRACMWTLVLLFVLDGVVFAPQTYLRFSEPNSYAGEVMARRREMAIVATNTTPTKCIVLGDSRMAEGFSAKDCNENLPEGLFWYNAAVSGSTPRTWYYLLKASRKLGCRFSYVCVPLPSYEGRTSEPNMANRLLDLQYTAPLVNRFEAFAYAHSFFQPSMRASALLSILFKGMAMRDDFLAFLKEPQNRLERVVSAERNGMASRYAYPGNPGNVNGIASVTDGHLEFLPEISTDTRAPYLGAVAAVQRPVAEDGRQYMSYWLGKIERFCDETGATLILFRYPRGPFGSLYPEENDTWLCNTVGKNSAVLPCECFHSLEQPDCFFDAVHMNAVGRSTFSQMLRDAVLARVQQDSISRQRKKIFLTDAFSDQSVEFGLADVKDNPWGKSVCADSVPGLGPSIVATVSKYRLRFGPYILSKNEKAVFSAKIGFYPASREWGVSDGFNMSVSMDHGNGLHELWSRRIMPEDALMPLEETLRISDSETPFHIVLDVGDNPGMEAFGDWSIWANPCLIVEPMNGKEVR